MVELIKHLPGKHDQKTHGGGGAANAKPAGADNSDLAENTFRDTHDEVEKEFKAAFPITKDLGGIRTKGTMQEDIADAAMAWAGGGGHRTVARSIGGPGNAVSAFRQSKSGRVGTYDFYMRFGIPTVKIGVKDQKTWDELKAHLREKKLLR